MNSVIKSFDVGVCLLAWKDVPEMQEQEENPHFRGCPNKGYALFLNMWEKFDNDSSWRWEPGMSSDSSSTSSSGSYSPSAFSPDREWERKWRMWIWVFFFLSSPRMWSRSGESNLKASPPGHGRTSWLTCPLLWQRTRLTVSTHMQSPNCM